MKQVKRLFQTKSAPFVEHFCICNSFVGADERTCHCLQENILPAYFPHIHSSPALQHKEKRPTNVDLFSLVRHIDLSWNTLGPSLVLMHDKLTDLGWVYYNGEIHIVEPETGESYHHES